MDIKNLVEAVRWLKVETGSLACLGCGYENSCSTRGCAILREAAAALERLEKYKDLYIEMVKASDDGQCVVLPCKVGDTVYVLNHHLGRVFENEVAGFSVGYQSDNRNSVSTVYVGKYGSKTFRRWKFQQFGKTVFLTREEAEAALRLQQPAEDG